MSKKDLRALCIMVCPPVEFLAILAGALLIIGH